jgi:hypothetical protein
MRGTPSSLFNYRIPKVRHFFGLGFDSAVGIERRVVLGHMKKSPYAKLAVAVCGGLLMAGISWKILGYIYERLIEEWESFTQNGYGEGYGNLRYPVLMGSIILITSILLIKQRKRMLEWMQPSRLLGWLRLHKKRVVGVAVGAVVLGCVCIALAVANASDQERRAAEYSRLWQQQYEDKQQREETTHHYEIYQGTQLRYRQFKNGHPKYTGDCERFLKDESDGKFLNANSFQNGGPVGEAGMTWLLASQESINLSAEEQQEIRHFKCNIQ